MRSQYNTELLRHPYSNIAHLHFFRASFAGAPGDSRGRLEPDTAAETDEDDADADSLSAALPSAPAAPFGRNLNPPTIVFGGI